MTAERTNRGVQNPIDASTLKRSELRVASGSTRSRAPRLDAIDVLRGFVIVLMVLDHARDFLHSQAFVFDPTDISRTTPVLFLTRWITHLCAPTFVFLSGVAIHLQRANGKSIDDTSRFLLTRGCWLMVLEFTFISFGINFGAPFLFVQVMWAIGAGMIAMSLLIRLRSAFVTALGALIVGGHQLFAGIDAADLDPVFAFAWRMTMEPGPAIGFPGLVIYPSIPWLGIMCLGYGLGSTFRKEPVQRNRTLWWLGLGALASFAVLRTLGGYGDSQPVTSHDSGVQAAMSFVNVSKYPPSLLYVLVTLGSVLLLTPVLDRLRGRARAVLLIFGRTPLFTYVIHFYLLHALAILFGMLGSVPAEYYTDFLDDSARHAGHGFDLPVVYAGWILTLMMLLPAARWFASLQQRRRNWWLSYF